MASRLMSKATRSPRGRFRPTRPPLAIVASTLDVTGNLTQEGCSLQDVCRDRFRRCPLQVVCRDHFTNHTGRVLKGPRHIGHTSVTKHTGHFGQGTSATPPQSVTKYTGHVLNGPRHIGRPPEGDSVTKHTGHFLKGPRHIGHTNDTQRATSTGSPERSEPRAERAGRLGHLGHTRSPNTRDTSGQTSRTASNMCIGQRWHVLAKSSPQTQNTRYPASLYRRC